MSGGRDSGGGGCCRGLRRREGRQDDTSTVRPPAATSPSPAAAAASHLRATRRKGDGREDYAEARRREGAEARRRGGAERVGAAAGCMLGRNGTGGGAGERAAHRRQRGPHGAIPSSARAPSTTRMRIVPATCAQRAAPPARLRAARAPLSA